MQSRQAAAGSAVFFVAAPCVVAGLLPWWIGHDAGDAAFAGSVVTVVTVCVGAVLILAGAAVLVDSFVRFVRDGRGTPAPVAPTDELVVTGFYRYVRNPMYVGVLTVILGQALLFRSVGVLLYAAVVAAAVVTFVRTYEEPTLATRYGSDYEAYRHAVRGWIPRVRPAWPPTRAGR